MKSKTTLSIVAVNAIEKLIAKALKAGDIYKAEELAKSISRTLTEDETNAYIRKKLKSRSCDLYHLRDVTAEYKASKKILEEILAKAVSTGTYFVAYDIAIQLRRSLTQTEVDALHRKVLRNKETPKQKGEDWHNILYCDVTGNRKSNNIRMELSPSAALTNKIIPFCLEHNLMKAGRDVLWISRGRKDLDKLTTADAFVKRQFEQWQANPTGRFLTDTSSEEVFRMASPAVVQKILKELMKDETDAYRLLNYAAFDKSGESYGDAILSLCTHAATLTGWSEKHQYLKENSERIARDMKNIPLPIDAIKKWFTVNVATGEIYNNFLIAYCLQLPEDMRDEVFEELRKKNLYFRCRDLFIERGGPDSIKDWVIACISVSNGIGGGENFKPDDVFKMGGEDAINKLVQDLLDQRNDDTYSAIAVAEKHYVSKVTREKVIARAIEKGYRLHTVNKLLALNRRSLTTTEVDAIFCKAVIKIEEKHNHTSNVEEAISILQLKPTKGLEESLIKALKKQQMIPQLIQVLQLAGRENEIETYLK